MNIQTIIDNAHIEWLSKTKTAVINGEEMTVLPYGYLSTAIKDSLTSMLDDRDKELQQKVGMLRQWLNEDRITDVSRMVTNEQILHWLK